MRQIADCEEYRAPATIEDRVVLAEVREAMLPIANSKDVETLFGSAVEAAITAVVSIFTIKLSLYLAKTIHCFRCTGSASCHPRYCVKL
jgi:hypothetical protein